MSNFIGGEFWYDKMIIGEQKKELPGIFLGGGQSCLYLICEYLKKRKIKKLLLPDYLCPAILDSFDRQGISYDFYGINEDFSLDTEKINQQLGAHKAILIINYFGLSGSKRYRALYALLQTKGLITIEDKAHTLDNSYSGEFAFNSYRKFIPFSGGLLFTKIDLSNLSSKISANSLYFSDVRAARRKKTDYINKKIGNQEDYIDAFKRAEKLYHGRAFAGDASEKEAIERLDLEIIAKRRRENYLCLLSRLRSIDGIRPIFGEIKNNIPLGLPVYVDTRLRNKLRAYLYKQNIFIPVHWDLRNERRITSTKAKQISSQIMTLVIDQRYQKNDLDRMSQALEDFFKVN